MRLQRKNNSAINRMFKGLSSRVATASKVTMEEALRNAVADALEAHEQHEWGVTITGKTRRGLHQILGDTYGWILLHDGNEVAREVTTNDRSNAGKANIALDSIKAGTRRRGWVGYVLACMEPVTYFSVDLERQFLGYSSDRVVSTFSQLFKNNYPVK